MRCPLRPQSEAAIDASSFASYRSESGGESLSLRTAFATSSRPQPVSASWPIEQRTHPVSGSASAADRVRAFATWSAVADGSAAKSTAAAPATCGAENDVPSPRRNSTGPQSE